MSFGRTERRALRAIWATKSASVIPSVVDDLPVTAIGAYAFEYAALTSVVIPEGVTVIDCEAFAAASALKENHAAIRPCGKSGRRRSAAARWKR